MGSPRCEWKPAQDANCNIRIIAGYKLGVWEVNTNGLKRIAQAAERSIPSNLLDCQHIRLGLYNHPLNRQSRLRTLSRPCPSRIIQVTFKIIGYYLEAFSEPGADPNAPKQAQS
jgi:hypothetical protein